jgi:pyridoxal 5-phosphate dependent beta-lyase
LDAGVSVSTWVAERVPTDLVHLDAAGAGRVSTAVLEAEVAHLRSEPQVGPYVAESAADLTPGRAALGALVGLAHGDVFFSEGSAKAFDVLLETWPLERGARVGTVPGEFGGHARALARHAERAGWELVQLPVDALGRVTDVPAGLDLLTLPQVASHRGVLQPVHEVLGSGVPVLLDVAQSAGQVEVPGGAAAYVGTSRKWLCGPRGVGFGAVDPLWQGRLAEATTLRHFEAEGMARYDSAEPHVAGRVGLCLAARAWSPALVPVIAAGAAAARVLLDGAGGWRVVEPVDEPTGITTLRHATADPARVRSELLAAGFLLGQVPVVRAAELEAPLLRVSTHAWVTPGDLEHLVAAMEHGTDR